MFFQTLLLFSLTVLASAQHFRHIDAPSKVYLIRHGEKPSTGDGLSIQGLHRAQCLTSVFGRKSKYNIGHIMAQTPQASGKQQRPFDTVEPLAASLGMRVDTFCQRDDSACVASVVKTYKGPGNILICWEHKALTDIVAALGNSKAPVYPDTSFDTIWTDPSPYRNISSMTSECCPGLDKCYS